MTRAREWQRLLDAPLNDVQSLFRPCASKPEGPAEPVISVAADRMAVASIDSKMIGCASCGGDGRTQSVLVGCPFGCLLMRTSLTVGESEVLGSVRSSKWRTLPSPFFERRSRAALHFFFNIKSAKHLAIFSTGLGVKDLDSLCWIALPSRSNWLRLPSFQKVSLLSRQAACSLALDALCSFCRSRCGRTIAALSATVSRAEAEANARCMRMMVFRNSVNVPRLDLCE